jgi:hypothetical protein
MCGRADRPFTRDQVIGVDPSDQRHPIPVSGDKMHRAREQGRGDLHVLKLAADG